MVSSQDCAHRSRHGVLVLSMNAVSNLENNSQRAEIPRVYCGCSRIEFEQEHCTELYRTPACCWDCVREQNTLCSHLAQLAQMTKVCAIGHRLFPNSSTQDQSNQKKRMTEQTQHQHLQYSSFSTYFIKHSGPSKQITILLPEVRLSLFVSTPVFFSFSLSGFVPHACSCLLLLDEPHLLRFSSQPTSTCCVTHPSLFRRKTSDPAKDLKLPSCIKTNFELSMETSFLVLANITSSKVSE